MKTALITGVTGQDGAYLARHLTSLGYRVIGTMPPGIDHGSFIRAYLPHIDVRPVDSCSYQAMVHLLRSVRPDEIYNLASVSSVAASWDLPERVADVNGLAFLRLLEAVRDVQRNSNYEPRICQASSSEMLGTPTSLPQGEADPIRPNNPYGVAKAFAHFTGVSYRLGHGMFITAAILFNHESPLRPRDYVTRKITRGAVSIAAGHQGSLELGRLDIRRDWGAAQDYVQAMHLALQHDEPGDYVVATGQSHSLSEFVASAFSAVGIRDHSGLVRSNPELFRPTDILETRGDPSRAESVLGWDRATGFDELVEAMVRADVARLESGVEHSADYL